MTEEDLQMLAYYEEDAKLTDIWYHSKLTKEEINTMGVFITLDALTPLNIKRVYQLT
jgi:hypothetical protein